MQIFYFEFILFDLYFVVDGECNLQNTYCAELDSTLLLGTHRNSVTATMRQSPVDQGDKGLRAVKGGECLPLCDVTFSPQWSEDHVRHGEVNLGTATLGRCGRQVNHNRFPLYHTCHRPGQKKRVTIVEEKNEESSV